MTEETKPQKATKAAKETTPSAKTREEPPKMNKVTSKVITKNNNTFGKKLKTALTGEDARSVSSYVFFEVIIPSTKSLMSDVATQFINRMLFGDNYQAPRAGSRTYTPYNRAHTTTRSGPKTISQRARSQHDFRDIIIADRGEAELVIDDLIELVNLYGHAKVSDLYTAVGVTGSYIDEKWGWTNLDTASVIPTSEGYLLDLPRPKQLTAR